jgi:large subunit ribosomal protein L5
MGIGSLATRKWEKDFSSFEEVLKKITWQKPYLIKSKKAISNFKLREEMPVMLKVTIRNDHAYDFIDRLSKLILPGVRDFEWLNISKFDWRWDYNLWLKNLSAFPELTQEEMWLAMGLQINICTTANDNADAKILLESLWLIFK